MRKYLLPFAILMLAALSTAVIAASVSRNMPSRVSPGEAFAVTFSASGVKAGELFTLEDQLPQGWQLVSWDVLGAKGGRAGVNYRVVASDNRHGFSFTSESASPVITLNVKAGAALGTYNFDAVYFDSSGQGRSQGSVTVRSIACGDNVCEGAENAQSCPADCVAAQPSQPQQPAAPPAAEEKPASKNSLFAIIAVIAAVIFAWWLLMMKKRNAQVQQ